jgi:hypothetical protein
VAPPAQRITARTVHRPWTHCSSGQATRALARGVVERSVRQLQLRQGSAGYACPVGFFDDLRPPPRAEETEEETPEWISAPDGWVGALVPVQEIIGRSEEAAICLSRIVAYPVGFEVTLDAFTRSLIWGIPFDEASSEWHRGEHGRPPAQLLRYGVEFADGRKATNLGGMLGGTVVGMPINEDEEPDPAREIRLVPGGGHGGGRHSRQELWVWPLPPPGPVAFVCEWPKYRILETRVEVDAGSIRDAAKKATEIWPASD